MSDFAYAEDNEAEEQIPRVIEFARAGNITDLLDSTELAKLGAQVVEDYERDNATREGWVKKVKTALDRAAQEDPESAKTYPFDGASNVDYPILTVASQQFAARAYPAIVKGDEAAGVKVLGNDHQGLKKARAGRVKSYLNYRLFYGMEAWEDDTDVLLNQLPVAGTAFKKVYPGPEGTCSDYVNPLRLTVAMETKSLKRCPRITQDFDLYPYEINQRQRDGTYRDVNILLTVDDDEQAPRLMLEQHRLHDLDGDGLEEPYIITVDKESQQVLRVEAAFIEEDVTRSGNDVIAIKRWQPFVKYPFFRDPKGRFYEIGFGHLLGPLNEVINTSINQLLDAGHAQVAGGGFIATGLRIQGAGQSSTVRWKPGEYKTVISPGGELRNAIVERTVPQVSPVLFQLLDLILGAAKDIASINDVITGDAPATAPVGTTLALIEQGLLVFASIYKRIYRAQKEELKLIYECERRWGAQRAAQEYAELLDDPQADFEQDFAPDGNDIVPVTDPAVVTKMQQLARGQFLQQFLPLPYVNGPAMLLRIFQGADIESPEELITPPQPPPGMQEDIEKTRSETEKNQAAALKLAAEAGQITGEHYQAGASDALAGGLGGMEGTPGDEMGVPGMPDSGAGPEGGMGAPDMGAPVSPAGPNAPDGVADQGGFLPGAG